MSMFDKCYCSAKCARRDCERNLTYQEPCTRIYTVSELDAEHSEDIQHINCVYFSPIE